LGETKQPLNYLALGLAGAAAYVIVTGGGVIEIGKWHLSFTEPHNLIHAAYVAVFVRALWWWRKAGSAWSAELPMTLRTVLLIHGGAIAIWFLLPKRLSYFLWFLSPANNDQHRESVTFMHGLPHYLQGLQADYLTSSWAVYLMAAGLVLALLAWPKLKPGSAAVFCFFAIAAYLTCQHPMLKYRFMHSWIAAGSVLSATGLVFAVQQLTGVISQPARLWAAGLGCAIVIGLLSPAFLEPGHAQEGGLKAELPSPLRITEIYLPALADARQPTIVSNVSARFLWTWTFIEHHHHQNMAAEIKNFKAFDGHPEAAKAWLESTRSEALVLIDVAPGSPFDLRTDEYVDLAAFHQALAAQTAWQQTRRWELQDGVTITMWTKSANQQAKTQ
jgi:hypothetical protein